jgi:phospholipase C
MMENHGYDQVIGNTADAPYINSLAQRYNTATNYHGVTHPSLPNYLATISGSSQGIWDDCKAGADLKCAPEEFVPGSSDTAVTGSLTPAQVASASATPHMFSGKNIVDQLENKGLSWKAYMESLPQRLPGRVRAHNRLLHGQAVRAEAQPVHVFFRTSTTRGARACRTSCPRRTT